MAVFGNTNERSQHTENVKPPSTTINQGEVVAVPKTRICRSSDFSVVVIKGSRFPK
jgi:hypothetical protein